MLDDIRLKVRALIEDFTKDCPEIFTYDGTTSIFTLCGGNITAIKSVCVNGTELGSGDYSFDSSKNFIEILISLNENDQIQVVYCTQAYSDSELDEYIRSSLVWLSIYSFCSQDDFELEDEEIYPTPTNKETDLISLVSSILIKPDYVKYDLPNLKITYPRNMSKEERIEKLITTFKRGLGSNAVLEWE